MNVVPAKEGPVTLSEFESAVAQLEDLETMPAVVQRLMTVTADPDCVLGDVEKLIASDAVLSAVSRLPN